MLAEAVQIHGLEPLQRSNRPIIIEARSAIAIGCSRRGIDEGRARCRAPIQKFEGKTKIGGEDDICVGGGGVGDGAEMNDRVKLAAIQPADRSEERRVGKEGRSRWSPYH